MNTHVTGVLLGLRALALAVVVFTSGAFSHASADGLLPGPLGLATLFALSAAGSAVLLARPASRLRLVLGTVAGQALVHLVLTITAGHAGDTATTAARPTPRGLPVVDGRRVGSLLDQYDAAAGPVLGSGPVLPVGHLVSDLSEHAGMMSAHLVASVLVGLWLSVGETALWTLLALAGARLLAPFRLRATLPSAAGVRRQNTVIADWAGPAAPPPLLARAVVRRGPPAAPAV